MNLFSDTPARLIPERPFPAYAFLPGRDVHPNKPGGHSYGNEELIAAKIQTDDPRASEEFCFALDLYHHQFFWEAHVYLEAIWNAHQRQGEIADLMKALIKLAAAGVKFELGQSGAARGHLERALELLESESESLIGIEVSKIQGEIKEIISKNVAQLPLVIPSWAHEVI